MHRHAAVLFYQVWSLFRCLSCNSALRSRCNMQFSRQLVVQVQLLVVHLVAQVQYNFNGIPPIRGSREMLISKDVFTAFLVMIFAPVFPLELFSSAFFNYWVSLGSFFQPLLLCLHMQKSFIFSTSYMQMAPSSISPSWSFPPPSSSLSPSVQSVASQLSHYHCKLSMQE